MVWSPLSYKGRRFMQPGGACSAPTADRAFYVGAQHAASTRLLKLSCVNIHGRVVLHVTFA